MCGRYTLSSPTDLIRDLFDLEATPDLVPRFNIAPSQEAPVVRFDPAVDKRRLDDLRWGLVPFWAKDAAIGNRMINARAETAAEKPAFRASYRKRRGLVVASGFYEWQRTGGPKQPFLFRLTSGEPFGMAGLWDRWERGEGVAMETFTILTTHPNEKVEPIHQRMPVILKPDDFELWLDPELHDRGRLDALLEPYPAGLMTGFPVSTYVNNPANEGPRCIQAVD